MGSISYAPKYYNPNWSQYSRRRKLWEEQEKRNKKYRNSSNKPVNNTGNTEKTKK
tara:strand:- start:4876 stop:5040 length:165 start_codon:yes stop_codon:yes gene_type:complete